MGLIRQCMLTNEKIKHFKSCTKQKNTLRPYGSSVFCSSADDPIFEVLNVTSVAPIRIFNYCFPILSGFGHFLSLYARILLYFTIRLSSSITVYETQAIFTTIYTLFADERITFVLGVVKILEFAPRVHFEVKIFMPVCALVSNVVSEEEILSLAHLVILYLFIYIRVWIYYNLN